MQGKQTAFWTRLVLGAAALFSAAPACAQEPAVLPQPARPDIRRATLAMAAFNALPWSYNWYVKRWAWANIGTRTWGQNLTGGFVWDNDCFLDNQLAHPYHGSLYFGGARSSGFGFWGSLPYVAIGSATWELFFENVRPSLNDLINTTLGGVAIGEVTHRLGGLIGSPTARSNAWLRDEARIGAGGSDHLYAILHYEHGSAYDPYIVRPYDAFEFSVQLGPEPARLVRHVGISGLLARRDLHRSERTQLVLGLYQHYDYADQLGLELGSQSVSGALLAQRRLGGTTQLRLGAHLETLLLGAISSDQNQYFRRDYDYGPGAGARLSGAIRVRGQDLVRLDARLAWIHSLHGAQADHLATQWRLGAALPVVGTVAVAGDVSQSLRRSWYADGSAVMRRVSESRAYLMWIL